MTRSDRNRRLNRVALAASLAIAIMMTMGLGVITVRAADDEDEALPDQKFFQGVLKGLGLRRDGDGIEYRERSPLVLPPSRELPPPETEASAKPSPASWPKDPDVEYAKKVKAARARPNINPEDQRPLKPSEYSVAAPPSRSTAPDGKPDSGILGRPLSPSELGTQGIFKPLWGGKEEYATFTSEPTRSSLTEPPPGYRTPSPNQPYGLGKQKWTPTVTDKQEPVR